MKRARFQDGMDDDSEPLRRRPEPPTYRARSPPPLQQQRHQERKPGFFGLPTELKQQIYALVLDSDRVERPSAPYHGDHDNSNGEIRYPLHYKTWRWPLAHWASRTFRNDLIDLAQDRLIKRQVKAELDMMVTGFIFFPTWLHLPPDLPGDGPFDLDVSLRIFSTEAFRSNDGWPRQPGSGFRILLKLLNQLVHEGPSFGRHFELLAGKAFWAINNLSINITFHDAYTPATHPETSQEIFRMLKALATSGLAHGVIKSIHGHCEYQEPSHPSRTVWDRTYHVSPCVNDAQAQQWRQMGFLSPHQRTLTDDYRAPWDGTSGGPRQRAPKLISPLERRDSPVGIIAPVTENPQMDDYGLITPPTPRAESGYIAAGMGMGKRRSTPAPAMGPVRAATPGGGGGLLDDYSAVLTPSVSGLLDDYSIVMTPVAGGAAED